MIHNNNRKRINNNKLNIIPKNNMKIEINNMIESFSSYDILPFIGFLIYYPLLSFLNISGIFFL